MKSSASIAPEICIEVMSPGNSIEKMFKKRDLYLAAGAMEVCPCSPEGDMRFYSSQTEELPGSRLVPNFPAKINIVE
jgi:Uma2 family endonuclease